MFCKVLFRIIFNIKKDKEVNLIPFDGYILMDIFFAVVNLLCYLLIDFFGPGLVLDETYSRYLMLLACFGALSATSRFFFLFLVIGDISKMLLTLMAMIIDSFAFLILFCFYHIFMA